MIPLSLGDVAGLVGGRLHGADPATAVTAVEVDSRAVAPGALFAALRGERTDGHDHAGDALARGAVAVLAERPLDGLACVVVPAEPAGRAHGAGGVLAALQLLAHRTFSRDQPLTFGVTGSNGKTSTKDLLAGVLGAFGPTLAPVGSFNNELGLPLTVLRREPGTQYAALEYSSRGVGHIRFLTGIVQPDVAVVLNVGSAHLGEFGSVQTIASAKGELVEAARTAVVLNADDPLVAGMRERAQVPVTGFGLGSPGSRHGADVRATGVELDDQGRASFTLETEHGSHPVRLRLHGEHVVSNALACAAAVLAAGVTTDVGRLAELLGAATPTSRWRMELTERADGVTVVNDAYNANPESMRAALKTLAVMSRGKTRRTVAVLGLMGELGPTEREQHMDLGRFAVRLDVSRLVVVGPQAGGIYAGAVLEGSWGREASHVADVAEAIAVLRAEVRAGDVVLVKASRSAGLERVAAALLEDPPPAGTTAEGAR